MKTMIDPKKLQQFKIPTRYSSSTYTLNIKSAWKTCLKLHSWQAIKAIRTMEGEYLGKICNVVVPRFPFSDSSDSC